MKPMTIAASAIVFLIASSICLAVTYAFGAGDNLIAFLVAAFFGVQRAATLLARNVSDARRTTAKVWLGVAFGVMAIAMSVGLEFVLQGTIEDISSLVFHSIAVGITPFFFLEPLLSGALKSKNNRTGFETTGPSDTAVNETENQGPRVAWWQLLVWGVVFAGAAWGAYWFFLWFEQSDKTIPMWAPIVVLYRFGGPVAVVGILGLCSALFFFVGLRKLFAKIRGTA